MSSGEDEEGVRMKMVSGELSMDRVSGGGLVWWMFGDSRGSGSNPVQRDRDKTHRGVQVTSGVSTDGPSVKGGGERVGPEDLARSCSDDPSDEPMERAGLRVIVLTTSPFTCNQTIHQSPNEALSEVTRIRGSSKVYLWYSHVCVAQLGRRRTGLCTLP
jgi:hypothetical protein